MTHPERVGAIAFTALHVAVVVAPAVVLAIAARKGGLPGAHGFDLVLASAALAAFHARTVWRRLVDELRHGAQAVEAWIAAGNGLVVLGISATAMLFVVLGALAPRYAPIINKGWHVLLVWTVLQLGAVALAEATHRFVFRWLEAEA